MMNVMEVYGLLGRILPGMVFFAMDIAGRSSGLVLRVSKR